MNNETLMIEKALLTPVVPNGDEQRVAGILSAIEEHIGYVPDGLRLYSFSPPLLEAFVGNVSYFNGGANIPPVLTAMIRYLVSSQAECSFCVNMNEDFLLNMGKDLDAIRAARSNPEAAPLDENEKSLLLLALRSLEEPKKINQQDLDAVRVHGWSDRDIFDAVVQAANNRAFNNVLKTFNIEAQGAFA